MMRQVPDCLKRRYQAVDELVKDLSSAISDQSNSLPGSPNPSSEDAGIKLMCKFWNILKEDPECNLQHAVKQRMALNVQNSGVFGPRDFTCYQMGQGNDPPRISIKCGKESCAKSQDPHSKASGTSCCNREKNEKSPAETPKCSTPKPLSASLTPTEPLSLALGNMNEAASMEKKCFEKTAELMTVQEQLKVQIAHLEQREEDEVKLLKEADAIWTKMESEYKQKLEESKARQEELLKQQKEVEASANKWRKNKKDLENQMKHVDKCLQEIKDKFNQKTNDLKCIEAETKDLEKKIANNTKEVANESKTLSAKREASAKRMERLVAESKRLQAAKAKEETSKQEKIAKGNECVKEAREELAKICRVLLKKKLENEDLRAEASALMDEIDLLKTTCDQCGERCRNKEESLMSEIEKCKIEIEKFKLRCTKCHVSTDTVNLRRYCTDCPRCQEEMNPCVYGGDKCTELATNECVCMTIKNKFMNNVFDNMYTVLERQIRTKPGKAVAEQVLLCLRNSTNGKLNPPTRQTLQNFILAAVKQNLNLTFIGGAVKTRCEMDPETYKELMLCLTQVKAAKPPKIDKGTDSRKEPCKRWGGPHECNCPKGPNDCICSKKAPRPPSDPEPCGQLDEDKQDIGELSICPHMDKTPCGPMCGNIPESDVATKLAKQWKPNPCAEKSCTFQSNMRAAQCMLGNDFLDKSMATKAHRTNVPVIVIPSEFESISGTPCSCGGGFKNCVCYGKSKTEKQHNSKSLQQQIVIPSETEFKTMFDNNDTDVLVTVLGQNGVQADLNAKLTKTNSGHMAIDVKRLSYVGEIADELKEYPVSLFKTNSSYKLFVSRNNKNSNAVLRRSSSGEMNVVLKDISKSYKNRTAFLKSQQRIFCVRPKNTEAINPETTLIKLTPSGNYEFVFEKEFEKRDKETVNYYLGNNTECYVSLFKTMSGTYIIDFDEDYDKIQNTKALLKKTNSGSIKLIVKGPNFRAIDKSDYLYRRYTKEFKTLYKRLSGYPRSFHGKSLTEEKDLERKPEHGSELSEDIRIKIQDQVHLVAELSVNLEKEYPGQYSVIFINETEASFTANLLSSWLGQLPIQKTTECELKVYLNRGQIQKQYGWLKLSSDGKVLVVVDTKPSKGVETDAYSVGYALKEKGVTTTCHGQTDCDCDKSKCMCDKLPSEWDDWSFDLTNKSIKEISWSKTNLVYYPEQYFKMFKNE